MTSFFALISRFKRDRIPHFFILSPILILLLIFLTSTTSWTATYYVATTGNDSNPGNEANPWRTIQKAANTMVAGDTVYIRAGTYSEKVTPGKSGAPGSYITYANYSGEKPTINASGYNAGFYMYGKSYIQIIGLKVVGDRAGGSGTYAGIWVGDNSSNIVIDGIEATTNRFGIFLKGAAAPVSYVTVKNSLLHDNPFHGLWVAERAYDITIGPNNKMYRNQGEEIYAYGIECGTDYGKPFADGPRRVKIYDNEIYSNYMQGIRTWNAAYVWIKNNKIHDNGATGIQIEDGSENIVVEDNISEYNAQTFEYETGIWVDDAKNVVVNRNYLRGNKIGLMVTDSSRVILRNNVIVENNRGVPNLYNSMGININRNTFNVSVVHNTLFRNGAPESTKGGISMCSSPPIGGIVFKNNILSETTAPHDLWVGCKDYVSDYNLVFNTRNLVVEWYGSHISWPQYLTTSGQDSHSIIENPLFTSPENGDFHLRDNSPCRNRGGFLTRTSNAGSGNLLAVEDASYFSNGFGVIPGDFIKVGANNPVRITNVNYETNTITVDQDISWGKGDGVNYPYPGSSPDMGAFEFSGNKPTPPTDLRIINN
jgi:parallel beta-helix repeat protein